MTLSKVREWDFEAFVEDTLVVDYGPNGAGCGPGKSIDGTKFDQVG